MLFVGRATYGWAVDDRDTERLFTDVCESQVFARPDQMKWVEKRKLLEQIRILAGCQESYTGSDWVATGFVRTYCVGQSLQIVSGRIESFRCAVQETGRPLFRDIQTGIVCPSAKGCHIAYREKLEL